MNEIKGLFLRMSAPFAAAHSIRRTASSLQMRAAQERNTPANPVDNLGPARFPRRFSTAFAAVGVGLLFAPSTAKAADPNAAPVVRERRGGFTFGVAVGPAVGTNRGYPNDARKVGRSEFLSETGFAAGGSGSAWVGITFNDALAFSLAGYGGMLASPERRTTYQGFAFRLDAFPAYRLGGPFRDLGVSLESGLGVLATKPTAGGDPVIDSGSASRVALGAFFEGFRAWKVGMGPFVEADLMWSRSAFRPTAWFGWRVNLTASP